MIYGNLGDPNAHEVGFEVTGALLGQIVEDTDYGQQFIPTMVEYSAKVLMKESKQAWSITNLRKLQ